MLIKYFSENTFYEKYSTNDQAGSNMYPGWSPRGNQRWTALFHSFDVFQRWFREHDKHQGWSALIFSESALFQSWTAQFQRETALNQRCSALIFFALKHWIFSVEQRWFSADLLWISSDIYTCRLRPSKYDNVARSAENAQSGHSNGIPVFKKKGEILQIDSKDSNFLE